MSKLQIDDGIPGSVCGIDCPDDEIFAFGFSRGASTIRVLIGLRLILLHGTRVAEEALNWITPKALKSCGLSLLEHKEEAMAKKDKESKKLKKVTKKAKKVAKKEKEKWNTEVDRSDVRPPSPFSS